jgi:uncharacterized protein GlcG (DUF336 family)
MRFILAFAFVLFTVPAFASDDSCSKLPSYDQFQAALKDARGQKNGGLNNDMWGALVGRDGQVCVVAYTGATWDAQWPGSRAIAAQKANTANAFSVKNFAISTANLYSATQPGGPLYGLQASNPVDVEVAYAGHATRFGTGDDPMLGKRIGGVNVFGGGLALYDDKGDILGGVGVSGDTSCADHNIAWRLRHAMKLDYVPGGVARSHDDAIIYDVVADHSGSGYGHPTCGGSEASIAKQLPKSELSKKAH